jgi:sialate O-acetylesterase
MKFNQNKSTIFFLFLSIFTLNVNAEMRLARIFSSNMVIQREAAIPFWGWANPGDEITATMAGVKLSTKAASDSSWYLEFPSKSMINSYTITFEGPNKIVLENVLLGDVWLCGGQSNMEFTFKMLDSYPEVIQNTKNPNIRYIKVGNVSKQTPQKDIVADSWKMAMPENLPNFSAVAYFFAEEIFSKYQTPIGLVSDNWGGSPAEVWMSPTAVAGFPEIISAYDASEKAKIQRKENAKLREQSIDSWVQKAISEDTGSIQHLEKEFTAKNTFMVSLPGSLEGEKYKNFDGIFWVNKSFEVKSLDSTKSYYLALGRVDDMDDVWVNGIKIGSQKGHDIIRKYTLSGNILKKGLNNITIRVIDYGGGVGISGDSIIISSKDGNRITSLNGDWKCTVGFDFNKMKGYIQPDWGFVTGWGPSSLFNGMIYPIKKLPFKGIIWYQGESNAGRAYQYRKLFPALIYDWRSQFGRANIPFLYVQLANFLKPDKEPKNDPWPELRESQLATLSVQGTGMAVAIDIGEEADIHPKNKRDVGYRLAKLAEKQVYGERIVASGPIYESMKIEGNKIRIKFKDIGSGLSIKGADLQEFAIAGADQKFVYAKAVIEKNTIVVSSPKVLQPVAVRYAWANNPSKANLYNVEGFPASPFRTDKWKGVTFGVSKID